MKKEHLEEDRRLLEAIALGDRKAFDALFRKYYPILCAYANRIVELADAEEIVGDTLLWVWENAPMLGFIESSFGNYLFKMVYNRSLSCLRKNEARQAADSRFFLREQDAMWEDVDAYQLKELYRCIQEAVDRLPESYRQAFRMHRFEGMSYKEIAGCLEVSPKTVDYRIQQSLKLLREDLKDYLPLLLLLFPPLD